MACAVGLSSLALSFSTPASAITCNVTKHAAPSDAEKSLLAGEYAQAETLYRAELAKSSTRPELVAGLFHALLRERKLKDAEELVKTSLAGQPASAVFLSLRGELQFREGQPWLAEQSAVAAAKSDPCNPQTRLLYARVAQASSRNAVARQQFGLAHQFDPEDPEIRVAWAQTLPLEQRGTEVESALSTPSGEDAATMGVLRGEAERWKKLGGQPVRACKLTAGAAPGEVNFIKLAGYAGHMRALGLEVGLNSATARIELAGGEGGLTVYKALAERAGLQRISEDEKPAFPGAKPAYTAFAEKLKIGSLEFHDCVLKVIDGASPFDDGDGSIGFDVFGDFLETVDYPMRKLQLAALPASPQEAGYTPALHTDVNEGDGAASPHPVDRVLSAEMKDWTQIYRAGRSLILPTAVNENLLQLFVLAIGSPETTVAPEVAKQVSKTYEKEVGGFGGAPAVKRTYANEITFNFAHFSQKINDVPASDTSFATAMAGMEVGGNIGADTYEKLILHLDYRDGLVKFEFVPDHGFKFK
ncbi:hypothetical protein DYQ86_02775 [Acidobacteria bacterium AB60]|nr:hypothetical protein DYQ86_02775 [Acidobacteria bacterium AB60]